MTQMCSIFKHIVISTYRHVYKRHAFRGYNLFMSKQRWQKIHGTTIKSPDNFYFVFSLQPTEKRLLSKTYSKKRGDTHWMLVA